MRKLSLLLAILFACLACYPCSDSAECVDGEEEASIAFAEHEQSAPDMDLCSPFCICSCCSSQAYQPTYFSFDMYCAPFVNTDSPYQYPSLKLVSHSIWQPPRLIA